MTLCGILGKGFGPAGGGTQLATPALSIVDNGDGTVTATISGSTAGTTNTLYYQTVGGAFGGGVWTPAGNRTGDGTLTVTVPQGYYWWFVGSVITPDSAVSNMVYQATVIAPSSVHWLCLEAAQARIQALSIAGIASSSIVIKKLPLARFLGSVATLGVPLPAVVLVPLTETQDPARGVNFLDEVAYGVGCLTISADNQEQTVAALMSSWLEWRQQINRAVRNQNANTFSTLPPTIINLTVSPKAIYDPQAYLANYDVSYLELRFISREPRGLNA